MDKITDNRCTLRKFTKGIKPASAKWWIHNKSGIEDLVIALGCTAIIVFVVYSLTCVARLLLGVGTNTTDFVGYAVFITAICVAIYSTILGLIRVVKACCAAGRDV